MRETRETNDVDDYVFKVIKLSQFLNKPNNFFYLRATWGECCVCGSVAVAVASGKVRYPKENELNPPGGARRLVVDLPVMTFPLF